MGFEYPVAVGLGHRRQGTATRIRAVPPRNIPLHMQDAARRGGTFAICCCCCARRRAARVWAGAARSLHAAAARERRAAGAGHACDAEAEPAWRQQVASRARPGVRCARRARGPPTRPSPAPWWWVVVAHALSPDRKRRGGCVRFAARAGGPTRRDGGWIMDGWMAGSRRVRCGRVGCVASLASVGAAPLVSLRRLPASAPSARPPPAPLRFPPAGRPAGLILRHFTLAPPIFTTHPSKNPSFACLQSLTW